VVTTGALLDSMVDHDVNRIVYASSNHAVGHAPRVELMFYGVGKVAAEALLSLYADRYAIDAVACRIGSFLPRPESTRNLSTWLSHGDCVRMVEAALTCPAPGYAVLYGISANTRAWWDLAPGRALGYEPQDDAEDFAAQIPVASTDDFEGSYVGGPLVSDSHYRPALDRS
jgi:uronate dehydrogenase